jgi:hypothetical protein
VFHKQKHVENPYPLCSGRILNQRHHLPRLQAEDKAIRNPEALAARLLFAPHSAFSNTVYFKRRSFKEYIWIDGLRPWIFAF